MHTQAKTAFLAVCLVTAAAPAVAQTGPVGRIPDRAPIGQINRGTVPDLVDLRINNGTFPQYRAGGEVEMRSASFTAAGPRASIELYFTLDGRRIVVQPETQSDGRLTARLPADVYARQQAVTTLVTVGGQVLVNRTGRFNPEIALVPADVVKAGVTVICTTMCISWPPSANRQPHWRSSTEIYDFMEHDAAVADRVGGLWSIGQTTYLVTTRKLKDQFRFTRVRVASPSVSGGCPDHINENTWLYPGDPLPTIDPNGPFSSGPLEIYVRANVTHCRELGGSRFDGFRGATHYVFARLNVEIEVEGPKGIDPWQ